MTVLAAIGLLSTDMSLGVLFFMKLLLKPNDKHGGDLRYVVEGVERVPWVGRERRALSRAMASFPPAVRTVMAQALRPLDTLSLVHIHDG